MMWSWLSFIIGMAVGAVALIIIAMIMVDDSERRWWE